MKHVDEFRDPDACRRIQDEIREAASKPWVLMDVCGGQTHGLVKSGIEQELSGVIELIHGPGCPVCVTPSESIDFACELSMRPSITVASFGDMLRVPGTERSLMQARSAGGDVQIVYSPIDAVQFAKQHSDRQVVFFAVGFETTAPATALSVLQASAMNLPNFFLLVAHVRVLPAMEAIVDMPDNRVEAFLAAGHVSTVMGFEDLEAFSSRYRIPVVVTGFEPVDLLCGIRECVRQLESGESMIANQYGRSVDRRGNPSAQAIIDRVYEPATRPWRGFGEIAGGGLKLSREFARFDASLVFDFEDSLPTQQANECLAADVMAGRIKPKECAAFGSRCTPQNPLGAPMVSSEGACAAYYRFDPVTIGAKNRFVNGDALQ